MFVALLVLRAESQCYDSCVTCDYTTTPPTCTLCMAGFFAQYGQCLQCDNSCASCTGSLSNQCLSCLGGSNETRVLSGGICVCGPGFFQSSSQTCAPCSSYCKTCSVGGTTCTACSSSLFRTLSNGNCVCMAGYKDVLGASLCRPCSYPCLTCTSETASVNSGCVTCQSGFYLNILTSPNSCTQCNETCSACISSLTCTACRTSRGMSLNRYGNCNCRQRSYISSTSIGSLVVYNCLSCDLSCLSCSGPLSTNCLTCSNQERRTFLSSECPCLVGFFQTNNFCKQCSANCLSCVAIPSTPASQCNSCANGYWLSAGVCAPCSQPCLTCNTADTICTGCNSNLNRALVSQQCLCKNGFFDVSATVGTFLCAVCPSECVSCTSLTVCTTCIYGFILTTAGATVSCSSCNSLCLTCQALATNCTSCDATRFQVLSVVAGIGSCTCVQGYYSSSTLCSPCHYSCFTCNGGSLTSCTQCLLGSVNRIMLTTAVGACLCISGFYDQNVANCLPCHYTCMVCNGPSSTNCISCNSQSLRVQSSAGGCICISGYFEAGYKVCGACPTGCSVCASRTSCSACQQGFYFNTGACLPCYYACTTCSGGGANQCTQCTQNFNRALQSSGVCVCQTGFFDVGIGRCSQCMPYCVTCSQQAFNCTSCLANQFPSSLGCSNCSLTCFSCLGSSTNCTGCPQNRFYSITAGVGACQCLQGLYENGQLQCGVCHVTCNTCSGTTIFTCLSCNSPRTLSALGSCSCPGGFYSDINNICLACSSSCTSCVQTSVLCMACSSQFFFLNNRCFSNCPIYYFNNQESSTCSRCGPNCIYCLNAEYCSLCDVQNFLFEGRCLKTCVQNEGLKGGRCVFCPESGHYFQNLNCVQVCAEPMLPLNGFKCGICSDLKLCPNFTLSFYSYYQSGFKTAVLFKSNYKLGNLSAAALPANNFQLTVLDGGFNEIGVEAANATGYFLILLLKTNINNSDLRLTLSFQNFNVLLTAQNYSLSVNNYSVYIREPPTSDSPTILRYASLQAIGSALSLLFLLMFLIACLLADGSFARAVIRLPAFLFFLAFAKKDADIGNKLFFASFKYTYLGFFPNPFEAPPNYVQNCGEAFIVPSLDCNFLRMAGAQMIIATVLLVAHLLLRVLSPTRFKFMRVLTKRLYELISYCVLFAALANIIKQTGDAELVAQFGAFKYGSLSAAYASVAVVCLMKLLRVYSKSLFTHSYLMSEKLSNFLKLLFVEFQDVFFILLVLYEQSLFAALFVNFFYAYLMKGSPFTFEYVAFAAELTLVLYAYLMGDDRAEPVRNTIFFLVLLSAGFWVASFGVRVVPVVFKIAIKGKYKTFEGGIEEKIEDEKLPLDDEGYLKNQRREHIPEAMKRNRMI